MWQWLSVLCILLFGSGKCAIQISLRKGAMWLYISWQCGKEKERERNAHGRFPIGVSLSACWVSPAQVPSSGKGGQLILSGWSAGTGGPLSQWILPSAPEGEQCPHPPLPPSPQSPASCFPVTNPTVSSRVPHWDVGHLSHCAAWLTATPTRGQEGDSSRGRRTSPEPCSLLAGL